MHVAAAPILDTISQATTVRVAVCLGSFAGQTSAVLASFEMATRATHEEMLAAEVRVLQAMCTGTPEGTVWNQGTLLLGRYRFRDLIHQLIFDTLREINTDRPDIIRQQLSSRLTNKGFPAVETEKIFAPHNHSRDAAIGWMRKLCAWSAEEDLPESTLR